jgi:hypothetical protein
VKSLHPLEGSWCFYDQIILSIVDNHIDILFKKGLNQMNILTHEIFIKALIDITTLEAELDISI